MNILGKKPQLIPKHQKGSGEKGIQIQYNGPQYYEIVEQMKKEDPDTYNRLQIETARKQNPSSEIVMYSDATGNQKRATNIGAGFLSGTDPIGAAYVEAVIGDKILGSIGNYTKAKLISKAIDKATPIKKELPLNVGWGPKQTIKVTHATNSEKPLQLFFDKRYDVTHEGANPFGIWYQGKWGQPRTAATNSLPGKAEKAAKARKVFEDRKYKYQGEVTLDKPITTVGEVPNRSTLSYDAEKMGADGIIYNNVYDNGYDNNQVILSFKSHVPSNKKGSKIYIKKKNRGKFTASAKAAGQSVQEHARSVLNDPNATPLQKKRANFAVNSRHWSKKHQLGGIIEAGSSFIPIVGTYQSYQDWKKDPSVSNALWTVASGVGDALQLTGIGYGLGTAIKGLKAANTARKAVKAFNTARQATRQANQLKMLEYGEPGKRAFQGWKAAGVNLRNSNQKLDEANKHFKNAVKGFGISLLDPTIDVSESIFK